MSDNKIYNFGGDSICLRNTFYPLVRFEDDKKKVLFAYGVHLNDRESLDDIFWYKRELRRAKLGLSQMQSLNVLYQKEKFVEVEKMVQIPCGCCRECLSDLSRQWSFRILKEAEFHDDNWFITFTYDDEHLPDNKMLDTEAISKLNKKLKTYLNRNGLKSDFRFYGVGEYGENTARPHYHIIYFGLPIPDLKFECMTKEKNLVFSSKFLSDVWSYGFVTIEGVDIGSACYVARYCDKKRRLTPDEKKKLIDKGIVPEFSRMSNRPGIGGKYLDIALERFKNGDYTTFINGKSYSYPLYYNKKIKEIMKDTPELEVYEIYAKRKSSVKNAIQMELSDYVDLDNYNKNNDKIKKRGLL